MICKNQFPNDNRSPIHVFAELAAQVRPKISTPLAYKKFATLTPPRAYSGRAGFIRPREHPASSRALILPGKEDAIHHSNRRTALCLRHARRDDALFPARSMVRFWTVGDRTCEVIWGVSPATV